MTYLLVNGTHLFTRTLRKPQKIENKNYNKKNPCSDLYNETDLMTKWGLQTIKQDQRSISQTSESDQPVQRNSVGKIKV